MTKQRIAAFAAGLLFAIGLGFGGMTQPHRVVGFLDLLGDWDPTLVFVMIGAIGVYATALRIIVRRPGPLFEARFYVPTSRELTPRLVVGSALFGVGWGLAGYCPGPALVTSATGTSQALVFVSAMVAGMALWRLADTWWARRASRARGASPAVT